MTPYSVAGDASEQHTDQSLVEPVVLAPAHARGPSSTAVTPCSVEWTSPPLEVFVHMRPGADWNAALTEATQDLIAALIDEADPGDFDFDDRKVDVADETPNPSVENTDDEESDDAAGDDGAQPCYFADLPGTVRWTHDGIWVGVRFRLGEDWRPPLKAYALDEAYAWTHETAEYDVDFRIDADCRS